MHFRIYAAIAACTAVAGLVTRAEAHHRDFTFIRDWYLPFAGEKELESRTSYSAKDQTWIQEFEFELGITDHFAIEPGIEFHRDSEEDWHIDGYDVELRFNFLNFAYNTILPALNVEYEHPVDEEENDHGELKFIFSYYTPQGEDFSLNLNVGQELGGEKAKESEVLFGYVRPLSKPVKEEEHGYLLGWRGGFESQFDFQEHTLWLGPVVVCKVNKHLNGLATWLVPISHPEGQSSIIKAILEWEW